MKNAPITSAFDISLGYLNSENEYVDSAFVSGYRNQLCERDCAGVIDGGAKIDVCGRCGGDGSTCRDCAGIPGGQAVLDRCGVCNGDGTSCSDCGTDNKGGPVDLCGVCGGDGSSCKDCAGVPNGSTVIDQCGVCGGNNKGCLDCSGVPNGNATVDKCGICGGDGKSCDEKVDCLGVANGVAKVDACGVCEGNNACLDCQGIPNGGTQIDCCGVCGGDGSTCLRKCKYYNNRKIKKGIIAALRAGERKVKTSTLKLLKCTGKSSASIERRLTQTEMLIFQIRNILQTVILDEMKLCDTAYCKKTVLTSAQRLVTTYLRRLSSLGKEAVHAAMNACCKGKKKCGGSKTSLSNALFHSALKGVKKIPPLRCD